VAADLTTSLAGIFGSDSKISRTSDVYENDQQEFAFSGINGLFVTGLGSRGRTISWTGLLRTSSTTALLAAQQLNAIINNIVLHLTEKTLITLIQGAPLITSDLYIEPGQTPPFVIVITNFSETSPRSISIVDTTFWAIVSFSLTMKKLI